MDMFDPIVPLQTEPEGRKAWTPPRSNSVRQAVCGGDAVYAPQDGFRRSTSALRLTRTVHNYGSSIWRRPVSARIWTAGFDAAGQLRGAGVRGELTYRWRHPIPGSIPISTR